MKKNKIILVLIVCLVLLSVLGYTFFSNNKLVATNYRPGDLNKDQINPQDLKYEVVQKGEGLDMESYFILVSTNKPEIVDQIALTVKNKECSAPCNIYLVDDMKAATLLEDYNNLMTNKDTTDEQRTDWDKKNYVYLADHYVGTMNYSQDSFFTSFPNRDAHYQELKDGKE